MDLGVLNYMRKNCLVCNKLFSFHKSRNGIAKYCGMDCRNKDYKEKHLFKGERNGRWQKKNPSYNAIHIWLKTNYGKANKCEKCASNIRVQWAKLKGKEYERKRENFWQLCSICHIIYDGTSIGVWTKNNPSPLKGQPSWNRGGKLSESHKEKLRLGWIKRKEKGLGVPWNKGLKIKV